jgi:hypothetical protein
MHAFLVLQLAVSLLSIFIHSYRSRPLQSELLYHLLNLAYRIPALKKS